ncbi:MAG: class I SAM-dependent methyltransferase [Myxococcota bacterium]
MGRGEAPWPICSRTRPPTGTSVPSRRRSPRASSARCASGCRCRPAGWCSTSGRGRASVSGGIAPSVGTIHAVDLSPAMLAQLTAKEALRDKVVAHCQDLLEAPLDVQVDLVVSAMAMHHVRDTAALLRALRAHLRPGGRIALADLDAEDGTFHPADTEGVYHAGFDREGARRAARGRRLRGGGVRDGGGGAQEDRPYSVFLVTARAA